MQRYWLYQENGDLQGPFEVPALALLQQQGRLQPDQPLQRVLGGDIVPAREVIGTLAATAPGQAAAPLRQALQLTPLNTAQLLDRTFEFCRQHFLQLFLFGCMANGLISFATMLAGLRPQGGELREIFLALVERWPLLLTSALLWLAGIVVLLLMQGALTYLIAETYLGRPKSIRQALASIPGHAVPILVTVLIKTVLLSLAFSLILIAPVIANLYFRTLEGWQWGLLALLMLASLAPGLIFLVRWFITLPVVMLEGTWGWNAIRRSTQLIKHHRGLGFWHWGETRLSIILLLMFVVGMLLALASILLPEIINTILTQVRMQDVINVNLLTSVLDFLTSSLLMPLYTVATTLFYLDLLMRREGLDLDILAHQLTKESAK